jgi:hypothetical protein
MSSSGRKLTQRIAALTVMAFASRMAFKSWARFGKSWGAEPVSGWTGYPTLNGGSVPVERSETIILYWLLGGCTVVFIAALVAFGMTFRNRTERPSRQGQS